MRLEGELWLSSTCLVTVSVGRPHVHVIQVVVALVMLVLVRAVLIGVLTLRVAASLHKYETIRSSLIGNPIANKRLHHAVCT